MIVIAGVIILAIAATMLLGEVGFARVRMANVADGALLSAASGFCRSLNQIKKISLGAGGLMTHYVALQAYLLIRISTCWMCTIVAPTCLKLTPIMYGWQWFGQPLITPFFIQSMLETHELKEQADKLAENAAEGLRKGLFNSVLGGALIDEQKPFLAGEVTKDLRGRIVRLDYDSYIDRDSHLDTQFDSIRASLKNADSASYVWNKLYWKEKYRDTSGNLVAVRNTPGVIEVGGCGSCSSDQWGSYLIENLQGVPHNVDNQYQFMPLIYFFHKPIVTPLPTPPYCACMCIPFPMIIPDPWAWIKKISIDSTSFGINLVKRLDFRDLMFFRRQQVISHTNRVRIRGSVWSGFDFNLEQ